MSEAPEPAHSVARGMKELWRTVACCVASVVLLAERAACIETSQMGIYSLSVRNKALLYILAILFTVT